MSTTVIASRHGLELYLTPILGSALDTLALREVLARHGITLVDAPNLTRLPELIAAEGLPPAEAQALATDLRNLGLTVRVVNRTQLTTSSRISLAISGWFMAAVGGLMVGLVSRSAALGAIANGQDVSGFVAVLGILSLVALVLGSVNALTLMLRGGSRLQVVGSSREGPAALPLLEELGLLEAHLPDAITQPLLERARKLETHARKEPDGAAARELRALVDELRSTANDRAGEEARELAEDVRRARLALRETSGS